MYHSYPFSNGERLMFERILQEKAIKLRLPMSGTTIEFINWVLDEVLPSIDAERPTRSDFRSFLPQGKKPDDYYDWEVEDNEGEPITKVWDNITFSYIQIK